MADPSLYTYPFPLAIYAGEDLEPLPNDITEDGKLFVNPAAEQQSDSYEKFTYPLNNGSVVVPCECFPVLSSIIHRVIIAC